MKLVFKISAKKTKKKVGKQQQILDFLILLELINYLKKLYNLFRVYPSSETIKEIHIYLKKKSYLHFFFKFKLAKS